MQPALPMLMTPVSGLSDKLARITSTVCLNATKAAAVKVDTSAILTIDDDIEEYHQELKLLLTY
jgi:hypothetical protein